MAVAHNTHTKKLLRYTLAKMAKVHTVSLVGAGPGDPDLITAGGLARLRAADVVLYDALVHPALVRECRSDAQAIFVGKRAGKPSERQSKINARLIEEATAGKRVVRLKGGDPYLFGRGSEEAEALSDANIPFEVIPGVPSPIAAAAYTGICLTHRRLASSVAYVTATESPEKDRSSHDWTRLATGTQTIVFFMGMRKLAHLMSLLKEHGRPGSTPAAVVESASLPCQRVVVGTVDTIADLAKEKGMGLPALTIVGDVVTLREQLSWFEKLPLFGKRILVGRAKAQASQLSALLREFGADPVELPLLRILPPDDTAPLQKSLSELSQYQWVLFTSPNAVEQFFKALRKSGRDARALHSCKLMCIGEKTSRTLWRHGLNADMVPKSAHAEGALQALQTTQTTPSRMLLPRALVARDVLPNGLRKQGHQVDVVPVYQTLGPSKEVQDALLAEFNEGRIDAVALSSGSMVTHLISAVGSVKALSNSKVVSIGPVTSIHAADLGLNVDAQSEQAKMPSLVKALIEALA